MPLIDELVGRGIVSPDAAKRYSQKIADVPRGGAQLAGEGIPQRPPSIDEYRNAMQEIWRTSEYERHKLGPTAKSLFGDDLNGIPFPYGGREANEAFVKKQGYQAAVNALDAIVAHQKESEARADEFNASITKASREKNEQYRDELLGRLGY